MSKPIISLDVFIQSVNGNGIVKRLGAPHRTTMLQVFCISYFETDTDGQINADAYHGVVSFVRRSIGPTSQCSEKFPLDGQPTSPTSLFSEKNLVRQLIVPTNIDSHSGVRVRVTHRIVSDFRWEVSHKRSEQWDVRPKG